MGWDVDLFPETVDSELICSICTGVLDEPVETPCRHVFCSSCVKPWLNTKTTCPQCRNLTYPKDLKPVLPLLRNILNKLKIYCENKEKGCQEITTIEGYQKHFKNCSFGKVKSKKSKDDHEMILAGLSLEEVAYNQEIFQNDIIDGDEVAPWIALDEASELSLLIRHKGYFNELKRSKSSAEWLSKQTFSNLDEERDLRFFMSRYTKKAYFCSTCDGCHQRIKNAKYKCLDCLDIDLCHKCFKDKKIPSGHSIAHTVFQLRYTCDGCKAYIFQTRYSCETCFDFDLCLDCYKQNTFPRDQSHNASHKMDKSNLLTKAINSLQRPTSDTSNNSFSSNEQQEREMCKRHKKYFEDAKRVIPGSWSQVRHYDSIKFNRDKKFFMARYVGQLTFNSTCDGCRKNLPWKKYRCLDCMDVDLCHSCYSMRRTPGAHQNSHNMVELRVKCDGCQALIIQTRFKCNVCHDFDLCIECYTNNNFHAPHARNHQVSKSNLREETPIPYDSFIC